MLNDIYIRAYSKEDKLQVINLLRLNTPQYFATEEESDFDNYLDNEIELYYILKYKNVIVGCGGINFAENNTVGKISWDILHPDYQGKSLGTHLLKHRIDKLKSMADILKITVRTSQFVYKFYEKQGFEVKHTIKDYWAKGFDLYSMEYETHENYAGERNLNRQEEA